MMEVSKFLLNKFANKTESCENHGEFVSMKFGENWSGCPECAAIRQKIEEKERSEKEQEERDRKDLERKIGRAAIPERFLSKNFENYVADTAEAKKALRIAYSYASEFEENRGSSLIFHGKKGTGKTHLAISIANYLLKAGYQPVFTSVYKMIMKVKESYARNAEFTEQEAIDLFIRPDLLIIDEVGVQFNSETEKMYLFEIINGRYEQMKSTLLISNLSIADIENCIGTRVLDRLREDGGKAVYFDWESHRKSAAK